MPLLAQQISTTFVGNEILVINDYENGDDLTPSCPDSQRLCELRSMEYREFLETPEWRQTRQWALGELGGYCMDTDCTELATQVHHETYERRGCEILNDLTIYCEDHHRMVHHLPVS